MEVARVPPPEVVPEDWSAEFRGAASRLADACRAVDPQSADEAVQRRDDDDLPPPEAVLPASGA